MHTMPTEKIPIVRISNFRSRKVTLCTKVMGSAMTAIMVSRAEEEGGGDVCMSILSMSVKISATTT